MSDIKINERIQIGDHRGTIRYFGQVEGISGSVIGMEWDDISRGKHSGNFKGHQYFTVKHPNSGSFVKLDTLQLTETTPTTTKQYSLGTDFYQSILLKYTSIDNSLNQQFDLKNSIKKIETVGFDKTYENQKNLKNLKVISINNYCIKFNNNLSLKDELSNLVDLDLTGNLLNNWTVVGTIVKDLNNLLYLNLSENLFQPLNQPIDLNELNFNNLKQLILNGTQIDWNQIGYLEPALMNLEELNLKNNQLSEVQFKPSQSNQTSWFTNLKVLNLQFNEFRQYDCLLELKRFPSLLKCALSYNQLSYFSDPKDPKLIHENLQEFHIDNNPLSDWLSISQLNILFPNLNNLKLFPNDLINDDLAVSRAQTLGKLLKLTRLNGSEITDNDRKDWERYYLSKIITKDITTLTTEQFNQLHPNYNILVQRHGEIQIPKQQTDESKLKNRLRKLNFHLVKGVEDLTPIQTITKSVLNTITILQLQTLLLKLFKLKVNSNNLVLFNLTNPELVFDLKNRNLFNFYLIEENDNIGIVIKD